MSSPPSVVREYNRLISSARNDRFLAELQHLLAEDSVCIEADSIPWGGKWSGAEGVIALLDSRTPSPTSQERPTGCPRWRSTSCRSDRIEEIRVYFADTEHLNKRLSVGK
ncbi:hypothetical protein [Nocardia fluminea]|uniref:hypothetical protein n=1 Tax=Nocardia fluminea TaxID=134984 RepID=UPI00365DDDA1